MITIAVCDDNVQFAHTLVNSIRKLCAAVIPERLQCRIVPEFNACDDVLRYLENSSIDILFLDIHMPTRTGFDLAETLHQQYPDIIILFVSAHEDFVYSSFAYSPFRFLRKSHLEQELPSALLKAVENCVNKTEILSFSTVDGDISLRAKDIYYLEGQKNYYLLRCAGTDYKCRGTLSQAEEQMENLDFYRIHAAYIINLAHIERITHTNTVQMHNGDVLNISQRRLHGFKETYMKFTRKRFES